MASWCDTLIREQTGNAYAGRHPFMSGTGMVTSYPLFSFSSILTNASAI